MPSYNLRKRTISNEDAAQTEAKKAASSKNIADIIVETPPVIVESLKTLGIQTSKNLSLSSGNDLLKTTGNKLFDKWLALSPAKQNALDAVFVHAWFKFLEYKARNANGSKTLTDFLMQDSKAKKAKTEKTTIVRSISPALAPKEASPVARIHSPSQTIKLAAPVTAARIPSPIAKLTSPLPQKISSPIKERPASPSKEANVIRISRPNSPSKLAPKPSLPINSKDLVLQKERLKFTTSPLKRKVDETDLYQAKKQLIHIPSSGAISEIIDASLLKKERTHLKHVEKEQPMPKFPIAQPNQK